MSDELPNKKITSKLRLILLGCAIAAVIITVLPSKKVEHEYHWTREATPGEAHAAVPVQPDEIMKSLRKVHDPEIDINIVDMGLIYNVTTDGGAVSITMTLTTPSCPYGVELIREVKKEVFKQDIRSLRLTITFDPPWTIKMIEPEAGKKLFEETWRTK
jgi:metal-sulfur cluster biosynthetic enzyme